MAVRSEELINGRTKEEARAGVRPGNKVYGLIVLFLGIILWVPAARWTIDGWIAWINGMAGWLGIVEPLPRLTGWPLLIGAAVVGGLYSLVEIYWQPVQRKSGKLIYAEPLIWVVWFMITASDVYTTYLGFLLPPETAGQLWQESAQNANVAALVSILLTFIPNWMILRGLKRLRG